MTGDYGYPIVGWRDVKTGLGWLGDDSSVLMGLGFNSYQIQAIMSAHQSGALSDGGYQALVSGFVGPDALADFLAADPGAPEGQPTHPGTVPVSNVNITLSPGPVPRVSSVPVGSDPFAWFNQATLIAGMAVPNWVLVAGAVVLVSAVAGGGFALGRR